MSDERQGHLAVTGILALAMLSFGPGLLGQEIDRITYLVPPGSSGWFCVEFGVEGAPALEREGDQMVVHPTPGRIIQTSDQIGTFPPFGTVWIETDGGRQTPPAERALRRPSFRYDTRSPVRHSCEFFGTVDEADAAGNAPGDEGIGGVLGADQRQALIDLYEATGGDQWAHKVGWLGPPGSECQWHGVQCIPRSSGGGSYVWMLELADNSLDGTIPKSLESLTDLEDLQLYGNALRGQLPEAMLQRWANGELSVAAEDSLLTPVTEVDLEASASSLLCGYSRVVLRSDRSISSYATRCRDASPEDRETFCEVKEGRLFPGDLARLARFIEASGFYALKAEYFRSVTHATFNNIRVTREDGAKTVSDYAEAAPLAFWGIQRAIEGVASRAEWEQPHEIPECPRQ